MKRTLIVIGFCSFIFLNFSAIQKENHFPGSDTLQNNARLKRISHFNSLNSSERARMMDEYSYSETGKVSKVSHFVCNDGILDRVTGYDLYEYNSSGQLVKILEYSGNSNNPQGFINLKNHIYTYSADGKKLKDYTEFPRITSFEYLLYKYSGDKVVRVEHYDHLNELVSYDVYEYDPSGKMMKETSYVNDNQSYSYTIHSYSGELNIKSDTYIVKTEIHLREINKTYDSGNKLKILESKELWVASSMASYVLRYEYEER